MKKEDITLIRIMSVAVLLFLQAVILVFALGYNFFDNIINRCNTYAFDNVKASAYNIFYYEGVNIFYTIIFCLTVIMIIGSCAGILFKVNKSGKGALVGSIFSIILSVYVILAKFGENSKSFRLMFVKLVADGVKVNDIECCNMIGAKFIWPIVVILLAVLTILMIKSSDILNLKMFNKKIASNIWIYLIPTIYATEMLELFRAKFLMTKIISRLGMNQFSAYSIIDGYYIEKKIFFNWSWIYIMGLGLLICLMLKANVPEKVRFLIGAGVPTFISIVACVIYYLNPPPLFGYVTMDLETCDLVENAFVMYMISLCITVLMINILNYCVVSKKMGLKMIVGILVDNILLSIACMSFLTKSISLAYISCIVADVITIILIFVFVNFEKIKKSA